ncbi:MAG: DUF4202 family protein [Planctomycetota bacterium]|nr:MAG: DUF4202 family protein [Planctomycetota bacterium]
MGNINCVEKKIERIVKRSLVPEDPIHAKNTLEWLLKLEPHVDNALKIAALGHDIERAIEKRKVRREDYREYDEFKKAHALNSARILMEIMEECKVRKELIEDVFYLVSHHEAGGNRRADILKDADSVSFFHINLPYYFKRNSVEETRKRCLWGYRRLPDKFKRVVAEFCYQNKEVELLVRSCINGSE